MSEQFAPNGTFTVATFSSVTTEAGRFLMSPGEVVQPPAYNQGPCPITQLVVIEYANQPKAPGWLQGHELFLHLPSAAFEQLKRAIMDRRPKDPPVTITWTNRENGFLNEFWIKGGAPPIEPKQPPVEPMEAEADTGFVARREFPGSKAVGAQKK